MSHYLPIIYDIRSKKIIVVGGGRIALEKMKRLIEVTHFITVIAFEFLPETWEFITTHNLQSYQTTFHDSFLDECDIVIVAVNDLTLQHHIFQLADKKRILCNAVDLTTHSHFLFPSIIRRQDFIMAFSTSGASPALSKAFKKFFDQLLPQNLGEIVHSMKKKRHELPQGKERMEIFNREAQQYILTLKAYIKNILA